MVEITAKLVKELRDKSGAGMMDCKKALQETEGDIDKAMESLRKSGIAKAAKRSDREAKEGSVTAYIHPGSKLGVLVEVNCETDFVANTDNFKEFTKNIAMHIAASSPLAVRREDLPQDVVEAEMNIFKEQALASGKPENIVEKISQGRLEKYYGEVCLLEQAYVKDPDKSIQDLVTETIASMGENISIKRFSRFRIGE